MVGILDAVRVESVEPQLRAAITTAVATALGGDGIAFLDLARNQAALSKSLKVAVTASLAQWDLEIGSFFVESLSLPDEVQQHLDKASSMRAVGGLGLYAKFQATEAIKISAAQPGGLAGLGAGAVAGPAVGQTMMGALSAPAAAAATAEDPFALIEKLHRLLTIDAICQDEFDAKKATLIAKIGYPP
jgi:membrane protease subunit (stomatin/prohibitin family)